MHVIIYGYTNTMFSSSYSPRAHCRSTVQSIIGHTQVHNIVNKLYSYTYMRTTQNKSNAHKYNTQLILAESENRKIKG